MFERYTRFLFAQRWWVMLFWLVVLLVVGSGLSRLSFSSDYRVFFGPENPQLQAFETLQETYSSSDNVLIAVVPESGDVFNAQSLEAIRFLTERSWQMPFATRVDSLNNYQYTAAEADSLVVEDLVPEGREQDASLVQQARKNALSEKQLLGRLVSPSGHVGAVNVTIELPGELREAEVPEVAAFVRPLIEEAAERYPDNRFLVSGQVMMNNTLVEASQFDMGVLFPITLLVITVGVGLFLRGASGTLATFILLVGGIVFGLGTAGWLGIDLSPPSASAPTIILTIVVADAMHLLSTFFANMRKGQEKVAAMENSLVSNLRPVFITSVTTVLGFLTLNMSDSPPFRDLGNITALGVIGTFLMAVSLLPALVTLLPVRARRAQRHSPRLAAWLAERVYRLRSGLMAGLVLLAVLIAYGLPQNRIDDVFYDYFGDSFEIRGANDFIFDNLTGIATLEYSIDSGKTNGITDPEFLRKVDRFARWLEGQDEVYQVNVLTDVLKRLNRNMHGDDPAWHRLPEQDDLAAQYLLLYEMSLPYGLHLSNQVDGDRSAVRLIATIHKIPSSGMLALEERAWNWLGEQDMQTMTDRGVSPDMMFAHIGYRNNHSLLIGAAVALTLISVLLGVVFRSVRLGLISLVANLFPVGTAFAVWGIFVGQVGLSIAVVGTMTLGIVVDDTVHFLGRYLKATRELGQDQRSAVAYAYLNTGPALLGTTLILMAGFLILAFSPFRLNADMGLMTALTIGLALLIDLLLLPALLFLFDRAPRTAPGAVPEDPALQQESQALNAGQRVVNYPHGPREITAFQEEEVQ